MTDPHYIPGTCNIGPEEIRRRYRIGYIGSGLTLLIFLLLEITDASRPYRLLIFPSLFYALSGFIQARYKFCYLYGWMGLFSLTGRKQLHRVEAKYRWRDRRTALKIIGIVALVSTVFTLVYVFV